MNISFNLFIQTNINRKYQITLNKLNPHLSINYSRISFGLSFSVAGLAVSASAEATSLSLSSELSSSLESVRFSVLPSACSWRNLSSQRSLRLLTMKQPHPQAPANSAIITPVIKAEFKLSESACFWSGMVLPGTMVFFSSSEETGATLSGIGAKFLETASPILQWERSKIAQWSLKKYSPNTKWQPLLKIANQQVQVELEPAGSMSCSPGMVKVFLLDSLIEQSGRVYSLMGLVPQQLVWSHTIELSIAIRWFCSTSKVSSSTPM